MTVPRNACLAACIGLVLVQACMFQSVTRGEKLRDSVRGLNDESRWSRLDLAGERVLPGYRDRFFQSRARWGKTIQLAEVEITAMRLHQATKNKENEEEDLASSVVSIAWYDQTDMTLRQTSLRQQWKSAGTTFVLVDEEIVDGDPHLFEETEPATSGSDGWIEP